MADKTIRLVYFDGPALGEPIRFLLSYGGLKFIDERLEREEIVRRKPEWPYGKVPVLLMEGRTLHQSKAICRFLAKRVGLAGKSELDALQIDMMVDTLEDFRSEVGASRYSDNAEAKEQLRQVGLAKLPYYLEKLEKHLADNGGHFVKDQLTWADLYFASMTEYFCYIAESMFLEERPHMKALREKVINLPGIKEYMEKRPPLRAP